MQHYLLKFNDNYADEFDIAGFRIYTEDEYKEFKARVKAASYPAEIYFGTNENVEFDSAKHYLGKVEVTKITESEAKLIIKLVGEDYGTFLEPNADGDEDEDNDDFEDEE